MSKKKLATTKQARVQATAPKPVAAEEVARPPKAAEAPRASAPVPTRPAFRRPQNLNFAGVGRNDICPCGSGKRFKNCHGH